MSEIVSTLNPAAEFEYNARVRELFADLRHAGSMPVGTVSGSTITVGHEPPFHTVNTQEGNSWVNHSLRSRIAAKQTSKALSAAVGSREQGFSIQLFVAVHDGQMRTVRYQAYGCPHFLAASESLARWLEGRAVSELSQWRWRDVEVELAVPASKRSRLLMLDEALSALNKMLQK
jgi:NifU-like protein involved in Fe-S cluster formation